MFAKQRDHVRGNEVVDDHCFCFSRGERLRKQKSLRVAATNLLQPPQLLPRFDAFGNDVRADASRQSDDAFDDSGAIVCLGGETADERAIDLQRVDREAMEIAQGRVPGPKVVQKQLDTCLLYT